MIDYRNFRVRSLYRVTSTRSVALLGFHFSVKVGEEFVIHFNRNYSFLKITKLLPPFIINKGIPWEHYWAQ